MDVSHVPTAVIAAIRRTGVTEYSARRGLTYSALMLAAPSSVSGKMMFGLRAEPGVSK
jgi:hypothetical protein